MRKIDTNRLSTVMNDTLIHRSCVMRSCNRYLAPYLISMNRSVDAIRLVTRCSVHDISKIQNTEEFMLLASIADELDDMHDVKHVLSDRQTDAIQLHWSRNSHHPEYYGEHHNDMSELDILEMACDCHARSKQYKTSLLEYIDTQQGLRFHFDKEHFEKLRHYCEVLVELSKDDDYSEVLDENSKMSFDLKDSTMEKLEMFDEDCYSKCLRTERLYLKRANNVDFASVVYLVYLQEDNSEVGYISLKFNGNLEYKIYEDYRGHKYGIEALAKLIEITSMAELLVTLKKDAQDSINTALELGFELSSSNENSLVFRLKKK